MGSARPLWIYVVPAVLVAAVIVFFAGGFQSASTPVPVASPAVAPPTQPLETAKVVALEDEPIDPLQLQIDELRAQLAALAEQREDESPAQLEAFEEEEVDVATAWAQQIGTLDDLASNEAIDETWASGAEATLSSSFAASAAPSMSLGDVECRSSICRMQMTADLSEEQAIIQSIEDFQPWEGGQVLLNIDPETGVGQVYVARTGSSLPGMGDPGPDSPDG